MPFAHIFELPASLGRVNAAQRRPPKESNSPMSEQEVDATSTETDEQETEQQDTSTEVDSSLGDAGKKALDAMKAERKSAMDKARALQKELDQIKADLALKDKPAEEQEIEKARAEARTEAVSAANKRILRSELKALATGKLADPSDAALYINLDDFTVTDDGDVDSDALNQAITDLLALKPHLSAQKQTRFDGDADQGAKGKESGPPQLTKADLDRMVAAGDHDAIAAAEAAGQFRKLNGIPIS